MSAPVQNKLAQIRAARKIGAAELARSAGVSRQTIYAIENGSYVPNTAVALRMAQALDVSVEDLFHLPASENPEEGGVRAEVLSPAPAGTPAKLCRVGSKWIAVPVNAGPCYLSDADTLIPDVRGRRSGNLTPLAAIETNRLALAGCDPAIGILAAQLLRDSGVELVTAGVSSRQALEWLKEGKIHIAGTHLRDPKSREFNLPFLASEFGAREIAVVTFAQWEEGFVTPPGNPRKIAGIEDVANARIRFMNREAGSGSRALFDRLLRASGIPARRVRPCEHTAPGHLAAAYAVATGTADCCIATRSAAQAFGLGFVPLEQERFDLVLFRRDLALPAVQALLDVLQRATLRRKLERQAGYETRHTGAMPG